MSSAVAAFEPGRFERAQRAVAWAVAHPHRAAHDNEWYLAIERNRAQLADLGRPKPPNDAERREIESGKLTSADGATTITIDADFANQTLLLSRQLDLSERHAASLLAASVADRQQRQRPAIERACVLHHAERLELLGCLRTLAGGVVELQDEVDEASRLLGAKMRHLLSGMLGGVGSLRSPATLLDRLLEELRLLPGRIATVREQMRAGGPALSDELHLYRISCLGEEARELGHILYLVAVAGLLRQPDAALSLCTWLAGVRPQDLDDEGTSPAIIVLTTLLALLDTSTSSALASAGGDGDDQEDDNDAGRRASVPAAVRIHSHLTSSKTATWAVPELGAVVLLHWALSLSSDAALLRELRVDDAALQAMILGAIERDALVFLSLRVLAFRAHVPDPEDDESAAAAAHAAGSTTTSGGALAAPAPQLPLDGEFQQYVLQGIQALVLRLTGFALPILRQVQRVEEDAAFSSSRRVAATRRHDIEALFDLVALLCRGRPDAGLPFWIGSGGGGGGGGIATTRFLSWAVDVREPGHQRALLDMLAALASGTQSAWQAHKLLSADSVVAEGRLVCWRRLFEWIAYYVEMFRREAAQGPGSAGFAAAAGGAAALAAPASLSPRPTAGMPLDEAVLLRSFLRLLRNVVRHSTAAREALCEDGQLAVMTRLFALYTCPVPVELKAALLDVLAALCRRGVHVATELWAMLDDARVRTGALYELERVEAPSRSYPGTTSLVAFLTALLAAATDDAMPLSSRQPPSLDAYASFVVDGVLIPAASREYVGAAQRWALTSACLGFIERCLLSYDLSILTGDAAAASASAGAAAVLAASAHPAFSLMRRLLTGSRLLGELLGVLTPGGGAAAFEVVNADDAAASRHYAVSVRRILGILARAMQLQGAYIDVLLPALQTLELAGATSPADARMSIPPRHARVGQLSSYSPLDTHLLRAHEAVVQVALLINASHVDVAFASVRLLGLLASSAAFRSVDHFGRMGYGRKMNRLVGLLDVCEETERVRAGYVRWLVGGGDGGTMETRQALTAPPTAPSSGELDLDSDDGDEESGGPAPVRDVTTLRLAILDLMLEQTSTRRPAPNVAWPLLGLDARPGDATVMTPGDEASSGVLHAVLAALGATRPQTTLSPAFAERAHALVWQLCSHPLTSAAALRYLRTQEDFFARQTRRTVASLARPVPPTPQSPAFGTLIYSDGRAFSTTADAVLAATRVRTDVLRGVALELHSLCSQGLTGAASHLLSALLGEEAVSVARTAQRSEDEDDEQTFADGSGSAAGEYEEPGTDAPRAPLPPSRRLLTLLRGLDFEWDDARVAAASAAELSLLRNLNLDPARAPPSSPREFRIGGVVSLLSASRLELERRGELADATRRALFEAEAEVILRYAAGCNAVRALSLARRQALQAWRQTLDVVLARAAHLVRAEYRVTLVLDALAELLPRVEGTPLSETFAGAILSLVTALRQHYRAAAAASAAAARPEEGFVVASDLPPTDRLLHTLRGLLAALTAASAASTSTRGQLYAATATFLQLVDDEERGRDMSSSEDDEEGIAAAAAAGLLDEFGDDAATSATGVVDGDEEVHSLTGLSVVSATDSLPQRHSAAAALDRTRALMAAHVERLLPVVARDALEASELWRTIALVLLDRICVLEMGRRSATSAAGTARNPRVAELLARSGLLRALAAGLRDMDPMLQEALRPDPPSLNAVYVYEASLALFHRLAMTRAGAARLLQDARVLEVLAQLDALSSRPERGQDYYYDGGSFLPAAMERYGALVTPALQLVLALLSASPGSGRAASASASLHAAPRQALSFLEAHHAAMLELLRAPLDGPASLDSLRQARLLVATVHLVRGAAHVDNMTTPKPLAALHDGVLALSAAFLERAAWLPRVLPATEAERMAATRPAAAAIVAGEDGHDDGYMGDGNAVGTAFDAEADSVVRSLVSALLSYLEASTNVDHPAAQSSRFGTRSCFSPSLYSAAVADGPPYDTGVAGGMVRSHAMPTLGMALGSLAEQSRTLSRALTSLDTLYGLLSNPDGVRLDEWEEWLRRLAGVEDLPDGLSATQIRSFAVRETRSRARLLLARVLTSLDDVEKLVVLLYRHFDYFLALPATALATDLGAGTTAARRRAAFLRDGADMVAGALQHLEQALTLLATSSIAPSRTRDRLAFVEMAGRKLQAVVLAHRQELDEEEEAAAAAAEAAGARRPL